MGQRFSSLSSRVEESIPKKKLPYFPIHQITTKDLFSILDKMEIMSYVRTLKSSKQVVVFVKERKYKKRDMKESLILGLKEPFWRINIGWDSFPIYWGVAERDDPEKVKLIIEGLAFFKFKRLKQMLNLEEEEAIAKDLVGVSDHLIVRFRPLTVSMMKTLKPRVLEVNEQESTRMIQKMKNILEMDDRHLKEFFFSGHYENVEKKAIVKESVNSIFSIIKDMTTNQSRKNCPSLVLSISGMRGIFKESHLLGEETYILSGMRSIQIKFLPTFSTVHRFVTIIQSLKPSRNGIEFLAFKPLSDWDSFKKFHFKTICFANFCSKLGKNENIISELLENSPIKAQFL